MKIFILLCIISQLITLGCNDGKTTNPNSVKESTPKNSVEDGGYSGGGGNINAYGTVEFKEIFKETVEHVQKMHLSVPFYLMFLKFDNKLPSEFDVILDKALKSGEGKVGLIKKIDIKFDSYCSSNTGSKKHASVDYSLDSTVCISSKGLELMSKTELKRKLLALLAHEYVHMLGLKDESLVEKYQNLIYNNYYMIDNSYFAASYSVSLRLTYENIYYFFYKDCILNNICSDKLEFSIVRAVDIQKNKPKRTELLSILNIIETQLRDLGKNYRSLYAIIESSFIDFQIWSISSDYLYADYPGIEELEKLKLYLSNTKTIQDDELKELALNFVRQVFQLNFIDRVSQVGLVSRNLFFNYCYRPFPAHTEATSDLLDNYFEKSDFTYKDMDAYLAKYGVKTIRHQGEVIYLPNNRMCSAGDRKIPAMAGRPTKPVHKDEIPLEQWLQNYIIYVNK